MAQMSITDSIPFMSTAFATEFLLQPREIQRVQQMEAGPKLVMVPPPATNWTTVAAILSQQIITNYTVIRTPSEFVPPGLHGHHWTIQANLDPEPDQWPERLVVSGESTGIWTHIGDGKYLWSKQP